MEGHSKFPDFIKHAKTLLDIPALFDRGIGRVENAMHDNEYCNGNSTSTAVWDDNMASSMHISLSEEQRLPRLNGCEIGSNLYTRRRPDKLNLSRD